MIKKKKIKLKKKKFLINFQKYLLKKKWKKKKFWFKKLKIYKKKFKKFNFLKKKKKFKWNLNKRKNFFYSILVNLIFKLKKKYNKKYNFISMKRKFKYKFKYRFFFLRFRSYIKFRKIKLYFLYKFTKIQKKKFFKIKKLKLFFLLKKYIKICKYNKLYLQKRKPIKNIFLNLQLQKKKLYLFIIIKKTKNNWFFNITDIKGNVIILNSCGFLKIKTKKQKKAKETLEELYTFFFQKYQQSSYNFNNIQKIFYKSNYSGTYKLKKLLKILKQNCLKKKLKFFLMYIKAHNGIRKKKLRRL